MISTTVTARVRLNIGALASCSSIALDYTEQPVPGFRRCIRPGALQGPSPYLSETKREKLLAMKQSLDSQQPAAKIRQLYAEAQAASLRALARAAVANEGPGFSTDRQRDGRTARLPNSQTPLLSPNEAARKGLSVEATLARILAKEREEAIERRKSQENSADPRSNSGSPHMQLTRLKKMNTTELLAEFKNIDVSARETRANQAALHPPIFVRSGPTWLHSCRIVVYRDRSQHSQLRGARSATRTRNQLQAAGHTAVAALFFPSRVGRYHRVKSARAPRGCVGSSKPLARKHRSGSCGCLLVTADISGQISVSTKRTSSKWLGERIKNSSRRGNAQCFATSTNRWKNNAKRLKDLEDQKTIRRTVREIERQRKKDLQERLQNRETVRQMMAVSQEEHHKAQMREAEEKKEDLRLLQESIRLEKLAEARRVAERQRQIEAHQSRADRIAETMKDDKVETATRNAILRYESEQAEIERKRIEQEAKKKQAARENAQYLKVQAREKEARRLAEIEDRRRVQQQQEQAALEHKLMVEANEKKKRLENINQQELLIQQIEEHKRRTGLHVSPTEVKMNRSLLEKVKDFKEHQRASQPSGQRRRSDSSDEE
ncbi:hypothetical protein CSUI_005622 [Cystoisospora suis]|uniref:Uncharacterized protein n=1 Tax=Cystoisospora suis TaxID=483139 RepID=A0A2C6KWE8_9APIC|nr:hypothetical protein CSUI_005622 [Cystoisospora suis]